jgi:hypothetical protein
MSFANGLRWGGSIGTVCPPAVSIIAAVVASSSGARPTSRVPPGAAELHGNGATQAAGSAGHDNGAVLENLVHAGSPLVLQWQFLDALR